MSNWSEQREQEIRELIQNASPLPWQSARDLMSDAVVDAKGDDIGHLEACSEENTALAVNAPQDLADLLAEVERLRARLTVDDDMVERAARAFYECPTPGVDASLRPNWDRLTKASPDVADKYRDGMTAALDAALGTGEGS